jgi:hypothetical protein
MTNNLRNYHIIWAGLEQLYPRRLQASELRLLRILALVIHGLIASAHSHLPKLAQQAPPGFGGKLENRIRQLSRFMANEQVTTQIYWLPFAQPLLSALTAKPERELVLCLDGSGIGRSCMALVASVVYAGRALPLAWLVVKGKKGHLSQARHLELVQAVRELIGPKVKVVVLGDGEFDGIGLLAQLQKYNWRYVVRTASNAVLEDDACRRNFADLGVSAGGLVAVPQAYFTKQRYGPILAVATWEKGYADPLYLVSNFTEPYEAAAYYKKRFRIECFFSDSKTRGFRLDKSHLSEPERVGRLLLGAVLAYWWLTYLGVEGRKQDWDKIVHRASRTDLSFFQLGWRILTEFLRCKRTVPFGLGLSPTALF